MAATTGYRTVYPALIPPGACHTHTVESATSLDNPFLTALAGGVLSSLVADFFVRSLGVSDIFPSTIQNVPLVNPSNPNAPLIGEIFLRLNCLTEAYSDAYASVTKKEWTTATSIRNPLERQKEQAKIDALVALALGLSLEDLVTIYQSQFPVMRKYDTQRKYDSHGRLTANLEGGLIFDRVAVWEGVFSERQ